MRDQVIRPGEVTAGELPDDAIIQEGDECLHPSGIWSDVSSAHWGHDVAELKRCYPRISAYRRPICEQAAEDIFQPTPWLDPGEGWRLLDVDEVVQKGDSVYDSRIGQWSEMHSPLSPTVVVLLGYWWAKAVRRRVEPEQPSVGDELLARLKRTTEALDDPTSRVSSELRAIKEDRDLSRILDALDGDNPDQRRIAKVGLEWLDLILRKNADYGCSVWEVPVLAPTTDAKTAILVRMSDKVSRIGNLLGAEQQVKDETLEDTLRDLGAYCLLYLAAPKPGE